MTAVCPYVRGSATRVLQKRANTDTRTGGGTIQPSQADKARAHGQPRMCGVQRAENPPHVRPERAWRGMPGVRGSNVPASHPHLRNQRGM